MILTFLKSMKILNICGRFFLCVKPKTFMYFMKLLLKCTYKFSLNLINFPMKIITLNLNE